MTILTDAEVGTMLRQDRDASEMTLGEAAELAGITPGALYRLCNIYTMPVSEAQVVADNSLTVSQ